MLHPCLYGVILGAIGAVSFRRICEVGAARFAVRIWYAALGAKRNQVALFDWAALRLCSERGDGLSISESFTKPATSASTCNSYGGFAARSGGISGFPIWRASSNGRAQYCRT